MKELGLSGNHISTPKTYETCVEKTHFQLINSCGNTILTYFDISLNAENKCLPSVYWLPKLHKKRILNEHIKLLFKGVDGKFIEIHAGLSGETNRKQKQYHLLKTF